MNLSAILNCLSSAVERLSFSFAGKITPEQKSELQELLVDEFKKNLNFCEAQLEYPLGTEVGANNRDRCDVYAKTSDYQIILELDATRADQVAKKMLSRYYYASKAPDNKPTVYVCLLYPGTDSMNPNECVKYMNMGQDVLLAMNPANRFIGGFIREKNVEWKNIG